MMTAPTALGLFVCALALAFQRGESVYCELRKNEFYHEQAGNCKKCDPCPVGVGKAPLETINFEISAEHGALGCLGCVPCTPGVTFSRQISHRKCRQCRNCTTIGRAQQSPCTATTNAKCMKIPPTTKPNPAQQVLSTTEEIKIKTEEVAESSKSPKQGDAPDLTISVTLGCVVGILATVLFIVGIYSICKRRQRPDPRNIGFQPVNTDGTPSGSSSEYSSKSTDLDEDGESRTGKTELQTKDTAIVQFTPETKSANLNEPAEEKDFRNLSKLLAPKSAFAKLGIELGVKQYVIDTIKEESVNNLQEQAYQTLMKWQELKGKDATKQVLYDSLKVIGRTDIAESLLLINS